MVGSPGTTLCTARKPGFVSRILVAVGGTILGAHHTDDSREKPCGLILLATPQEFAGAVDADHLIRDGRSERLEHNGDFGMGKPSHGSQPPSGVDRDHSTGGTQCVGHVRKTSAPDEPIGRARIVAVFVSDWLPKSDSHREQCDFGQFFHDCCIGCDMVVLVADGTISDVVPVVCCLWSGILFRPDRIGGRVMMQGYTSNRMEIVARMQSQNKNK